MRFLVNVIILGATVCLSVPCMATDFYYGTEGPITLVIDSSKALIKPSGGTSQDDLESALSTFQHLVAVPPDDQPIDQFVVCSLSTGEGYMPFLDSIQTAKIVIGWNE